MPNQIKELISNDFLVDKKRRPMLPLSNFQIGKNVK